jgi:DNA-binding CsgD family transcriptional regulator
VSSSDQELTHQLGRTEILLDRTAHLAEIGTFRWDLATDRVLWSERATALMGLSDEATGGSTAQLIDAAVHPHHRERAYDVRERSLSEASTVPAAEWLLLDRDDHLRWIAMTMAPAAWAGSRATEMVGSVRNVTDEHECARERDTYLAAFRSFSGWNEPGGGSATLIEGLVRALGWEAGAVWKEQADGSMTRQAHWNRSGRVPPPGAPRQEGALIVPARSGGRVLASLELQPGDGPALGPALEEAVRTVADTLGDFLVRHRSELAESPLTPRETEVLTLASHGGSSAHVAGQLVVSPSTVKTHFEHIYAKLGVTDRAGAVAEAMRRGLID